MTSNLGWLIQVVVIIYMLSLNCVYTAHYDDESSLRTAVLTGYEYKIRPASTVSVSAKLSLLNINVLDVPSQRLSVAGWLVFKWNDPRLTWTPSSYGNIEDIYDTELVLWRPEVIVDNSVSNLGILESDKLLIRATYEGNMTWEPPGIYETHCDVDVTFYPFDTQTCVVEITSWAYTLNEVDLDVNESTIDLADFEESGEWDILSTWAERLELQDGADTHSEIQFSLKLQRKPAYYVTTILIPVIVTSILCVVVFLLPAESGEKVGYSLTILLTYTVMLTLVASYMPPTSKHTSVLSVYLVIILFVGVFSTLLTVFVLYFHHQPKDEEVPRWLQASANGCMGKIARWGSAASKGKEKNSEITPGNGALPLNHQINKVHPGREARVSIGGNIEGNKNTGSQTPSHVVVRSKEEEEAHEVTWQELSVLLDAFCFRVLGSFVFLFTLIILMTMVIGGYA